MGIETARREYADLKVVLVDADDYDVGMFKSVAASIGIHNVTTYTSPKAAIGNIEISGAPDILFLKFDGSSDDSIQLCRFLRNRDTSPHPYVALVAVLEQPTIALVTGVRDVGVDEFLACPFSPKAVHERIKAILHDRRGFVDVPGYFGPDRRRGAMAKWLGSDRRSEPTTLINPVTQEAYIG
jgi:two-component system, chemotaxis family, chemotaxis protein CheY